MSQSAADKSKGVTPANTAGVTPFAMPTANLSGKIKAGVA